MVVVKTRSEKEFLELFEGRLDILEPCISSDSAQNLRHFGKPLYRLETRKFQIDFARLVPVARLKPRCLRLCCNGIEYRKLLDPPLFIGPYWLVNASLVPIKSQNTGFNGNFIETLAAILALGGTERELYSFAMPEAGGKERLALARNSLIDIELCCTAIPTMRLVYYCCIGSEWKEFAMHRGA